MTMRSAQVRDAEDLPRLPGPEPDRGAEMLGRVMLTVVFVVGILLGFLAARCNAAELTIAWTDPVVEDADCDTTGPEAPLLDGVGTYVEWRKNLGDWSPVPLSTRPLVPGQPRTRTLSLSGGVWRIRVIAYDDAGNLSPVCDEIWAVVMLGRIWWKWKNET